MSQVKPAIFFVGGRATELRSTLISLVLIAFGAGGSACCTAKAGAALADASLGERSR